MAVLTINGITLPIRQGDLKSRPEQVGETGRAASGAWRNHRRNVKAAWDVSLRHLSFREAAAWSSVLRGEHHVFSFDASLYSSKGQRPSSGYTAALGGGAGKYGVNYLSVPASTSIGWDLLGTGTAGDPLTYGISVWRKETGTWKHYFVDSLGQKWVNGVRNDAATTTFLTISASGEVTLTGAASLTDFDDLVVFPAPLPTTWPPLIYATARAYPLSPRLEAYGDLIPGSSASVPLYVQGEAEEMSHEPAKFSGTADKLAATVQAIIRRE